MSRVRVSDIVRFLNQWAPFSLQESYDNSGLLTGDPEMQVKGIMASLDCTEAVLEEAVSRNCNVVVAHHPVLFKALKSLTGRNYVERTLISAIRKNIAIIAFHTNLDNIHTGVNSRICQRLGLVDTEVLQPIRGNLMKLVTFTPESHAGQVLDALYDAGAGRIGKYDRCSFRAEGQGSYRPLEGANPWQGKPGQEETATEIRLEVILPGHAEQAVLTALKKAHPYEEVAYYLTTLNNLNQETGAGMVGNLPEEMDSQDFIKYLKNRMLCDSIRHTELCFPWIRRVAVCGGAGSFLTGMARQSGAQIFVSADFKYHEFFDADGKIIIADIGHFESEQFTGELVAAVLAKNFPTFASLFSEVKTNPIRYA